MFPSIFFRWEKSKKAETEEDNGTMHNLLEQHRKMDWHTRSGTHQKCKIQTDMDGRSHSRRPPQKPERERMVRLLVRIVALNGLQN